MSKYTVAGVSKLNGEFKVRFAHDLMYVKGLSKAGNTDIELVEAPSAMEKPELTLWLKTTELYNRAEFKEAIDDRAAMYDKLAKVKAPKAPKATKAVKAKKVAAPAKSKAEKLAELAARVPVTE
jgi:hypothetical protein